MARILLLTAELQQARGFTQHRVKAIRHALRAHNCSVFVVDTTFEDNRNPFHPQFKKRLSHALAGIDAVVTAGPFHPLLALPHLPTDLPLWVDLPSDPMADMHLQWLAEPMAEAVQLAQATAKQALSYAMARGDQFGLISPEHRHAFWGQLLFYGRRLEKPTGFCHITPISRPLTPPLPPPMRDPQSPLVLLLSGQANTWLHTEAIIDGLKIALSQIPNLKIRITGGARPQAPKTWRHLTELKNHRIRLEGWLSDTAYRDCIKETHAGFWLDRAGIEPILGCRTRGITMLHHRRPLIASPSNSWHRELASKGVLRPATDGESLAQAIVEEWNSPSCVPADILTSRHVDTVFEPLRLWLDAPTQSHHPMADPFSDAHLKLQEDYLRLLNSPSVRSLNWLHRKLRTAFRLFEGH